MFLIGITLATGGINVSAPLSVCNSRSNYADPVKCVAADIFFKNLRDRVNWLECYHSARHSGPFGSNHSNFTNICPHIKNHHSWTQNTVKQKHNVRAVIIHPKNAALHVLRQAKID